MAVPEPHEPVEFAGIDQRLRAFPVSVEMNAP
jgi:hypothetical protein